MVQTKKKTTALRRSTSKIVAEKKSRYGKNWVIAVDPFADINVRPIWRFSQYLAQHFAVEVQAAYVLAPSSLNWTGNFSGPWMKKYQPLAEEKLQAVLPEASISIIPCSESGQHAAVQALLRFTQKVKAEGLVISTHARSGLERLTLGSFTETVILGAKIPVLVMNPAQKVPREVKKILVPTDLSAKNDKLTAATADYAKHFGAEIILYHKQPDPLDLIIQQGVYSLGGGWVSVQSYIDDELDYKNKRLEKIETRLRKRGLTVRHIFDSSPGTLVDGIDNAARANGADMISVLTQTGSWGAALLGSVARGLVRKAEVPVLVTR